MTTHSRRLWLVTAACAGVLVLAADAASAQESKSEALARELAQALEAAKLTTFAAKDPKTEGEYVAAMYFPGSQLLVVSARYSVPVLLDEKLAEKKYMDVYVDLNSASVPETKVFVSDLLADGLHPRPDEGEPFDTIDRAGTQIAFDRNRARQMSEDEYTKQFSDADERYVRMLTILLSALKG